MFAEAAVAELLSVGIIIFRADTSAGTAWKTASNPAISGEKRKYEERLLLNIGYNVYPLIWNTSVPVI